MCVEGAAVVFSKGKKKPLGWLIAGDGLRETETRDTILVERLQCDYYRLNCVLCHTVIVMGVLYYLYRNSDIDENKLLLIYYNNESCDTFSLFFLLKH